MRDNAYIAVVMPARNEERSVGRVIAAIPPWVDEIVVCDNGSTDRTADVASEHGARVVFESRRGYGSACQAALATIDQADIVVFLDADFSDHPEEMGGLVDPIVRDEADLVIGSRVRGQSERGALTLQQRFGNRLACFLLRLIWNVSYTDLGPFRAIRFTSLKHLDMCDPNYGWTVEMQMKAAANGLRAMEIPVSYRVRIGKSKISGTVRGVVGAGTKIILTILRSAFQRRHASTRLRPGAIPAQNAQRHLIVFTRYPESRVSKTRLIPALGAEGAADASRELTMHALRWVRKLPDGDDIKIEVRFTGGDAKLIGRMFGNDLLYTEQGDGDLGDRLVRATEDAFAGGAQHVVVVGTDCPALDENIVREAFTRLAIRDLVLGPAQDGGYYLIGVARSYPEVFQGIQWGGETVLRETLARAERLGLSITQLETLRDIDTPDDLTHWEAVLRRNESPDGVG